ncbi:hypothetical protein HDU98_007642 [Podochytrium sp. JEL0797]|nr:hypothetical protein HDU98_007642 [Podochytrium sp. JEL0797]
MERFACTGSTTLTFYAYGKSSFGISWNHAGQHAPYKPNTLELWAKTIVEDNIHHNSRVAWKAVQRHAMENSIPLSFRAKAVRDLHNKLTKHMWYFDDDPWVSARLFVENDARSPKPTFALIQLHDVLEAKSLAFAVQDAAKYFVRIKEGFMDATENTNSSSASLFLFEGYTSEDGSIPLGYCFIRTTARNDAVAGVKKAILTDFLQYFKNAGCELETTFSDKDFSEINAFHAVWPNSKHQLCYWHCNRAIKKRLAALRQHPRPYNGDAATAVFDFIDPNFVPISQVPKELRGSLAKPPPRPVKRPQRFLVKSIPQTETLADDSHSDDLHSDDSGDEVQERFFKLIRRGLTGEITEQEAYALSLQLQQHVETDILSPPQHFNDSDSRSGNDSEESDDEIDSDDEGEEEEVICGDGLGAIAAGASDNARATVEVFAVDDKEYSGMDENRNQLREVWAYMWNDWYRRERWPLWARSSVADTLSTKRTTMIVESHWQKLKHIDLAHFNRPRMDRLAHVLANETIPRCLLRLPGHESTDYRITDLTSHQKGAKQHWKKCVTAKINGHYDTRVSKWTCNCGSQKYSPYLICKHLVQQTTLRLTAHLAPDISMLERFSKIPASFFKQLYLRTSPPFYTIPGVCPPGDVPNESFFEGDEFERLEVSSPMRRRLLRTF